MLFLESLIDEIQRNISRISQMRQSQEHQLWWFVFDSKEFQYGLKSNIYLGCKLWNDFALIIENSPSKDSFKSKLKNYLLNSQCKRVAHKVFAQAYLNKQSMLNISRI